MAGAPEEVILEPALLDMVADVDRERCVVVIGGLIGGWMVVGERKKLRGCRELFMDVSKLVLDDGLLRSCFLSCKRGSAVLM